MGLIKTGRSGNRLRSLADMTNGEREWVISQIIMQAKETLVAQGISTGSADFHGLFERLGKAVNDSATEAKRALRTG